MVTESDTLKPERQRLQKAYVAQAAWLKTALSNEVNNVKLLEKQQRVHSQEDLEGEQRRRQTELQAKEASEQKHRALLLDERAKAEMKQAAKMIEEARLAAWSIKQAKQEEVVQVQRQSSKERAEHKKELNQHRQLKASVAKLEQSHSREQLNVLRHHAEQQHDARVERQRSLEREHFVQHVQELEDKRQSVIVKAVQMTEDKRAAANVKVTSKLRKSDAVQRQQHLLWNERLSLQAKVDDIYCSVKTEVAKQQVASCYDAQLIQQQANMLMQTQFSLRQAMATDS